jgi:diguanylate cyclase (GGDEF)-like protein/PAS domain S-box-containing protein
LPDYGRECFLEKEKIRCWEAFHCGKTACPVYQLQELNCWLVPSTHCRDEIQGEFLEKMELCLKCEVFGSNMDISAMNSTVGAINRQFKEFKEIVEDRDKQLEDISMDLAIGISEVLQALDRIASGDPTVRIPEESQVELIAKLKQIVNLTAKEIGEFVDQSHEFAIGLAEHFDILDKVSKGNLKTRVSDISQDDLLKALGKVTNKMIESIEQEIHKREKVEEELRELESLESSVLRAIPHAIVGLKNRRIILANDSVESVFGWKPEEVIGQSTRIFYRSEEEFVSVGNLFYPVLRKQRVFHEEFPCRKKDGTEILCRISAAVRGQEMMDFEIVVMYEDITERKLAEEELLLNELRLGALISLNRMTDRPMSELTDFALERAIIVTRSKIGYLAFMNEDETVLTMHSWSKQAMDECGMETKPLVYPVETTGLWGEAVRQRKPILTNDYQSQNTLKKGYPEGHVHINRHMNIPLFDGDKIVLVAGVGNKEKPYDQSDVRQLTLLMDGMWKIIKQRRADELLREKEEREALILRSLPMAFYTARSFGDFIGIWASEQIEKISGFHQKRFAEEPDLWVSRIHPDDHEMVIKAFDSIYLRGTAKSEYRWLNSDGSYLWFHDEAVLIRDEKGNPKEIIGTWRDVTDRKQMEETLRTLSLIDELTRLYNRRGFFALVEQQMKIANRTGKGMIVLFADLDGLKQINDSLGHQAGDKALIDIADILRETFRESDIIARIGGDEYVVLILEPLDGVNLFSKRLSERIGFYNRRDGINYKLSISTGIAIYDPQYPCSIDELLKRADTLMYEQKREKKRMK